MVVAGAAAFACFSAAFPVIGHDAPLSFGVTPSAGAKEGTKAAGHSAAVIGFWGNCHARKRSLRGRGKGSQNPSLTASGGGYSAARPPFCGHPKEVMTSQPRKRRREGQGSTAMKRRGKAAQVADEEPPPRHDLFARRERRCEAGEAMRQKWRIKNGACYMRRARAWIASEEDSCRERDRDSVCNPGVLQTARHPVADQTR